MGEFNSDDHYIYYCGKQSIRKNGVALTVNKRVQNAVPGCSLRKQNNDLCLFPRQTIQYHSNDATETPPSKSAITFMSLNSITYPI